jgi:hypothetical protein
MSSTRSRGITSCRPSDTGSPNAPDRRYVACDLAPGNVFNKPGGH